MKKIILIWILIIAIFIILTPIVSSAISSNEKQSTKTYDNQGAEIKPYIYGTIRLFFAPAIYWGIANYGDMTAENVSGIFTVEGGFDDSINFIDSYNYGEIKPEYVSGRYLSRNIDGFGPIVLSLKATASNAEDIDISVKGFQIGYRTFVFGWIKWRK